MKTAAITVVVLAFGSTAHPSERVCIYINANTAPMDVVGVAEGISTRMFAKTGVSLEWRIVRSGLRPTPPGRIIVINFERDPRSGISSSALAYALPFEGVHIVVLYDRIRSASRDNPVLRPTILAHVLTHEITHILQGFERHSATGVMKERWDATDYFEMMRTQLPFTPEDFELIRLGCARFQAAHVQPPLDAK
jgi:hypothetical protein